MKLTGLSRDELASALAGKTRPELLELIFSLVTFDRLVSASEIARACRVSRRDVLADMKAGKFSDPIFGAGFFCRAANSLRVSVCAANAWRRSFFVAVPSADSLPPHKRESVSSPGRLTQQEKNSALGRHMSQPPQTGVEAENREQMRHGFGLTVELADQAK